MERERPAGQLQRERERQQELQLLRRKNAELAMQTKKLEEKVRSLEKVGDSSSFNKKGTAGASGTSGNSALISHSLTSVFPSRQKKSISFSHPLIGTARLVSIQQLRQIGIQFFVQII